MNSVFAHRLTPKTAVGRGRGRKPSKKSGVDMSMRSSFSPFGKSAPNTSINRSFSTQARGRFAVLKVETLRHIEGLMLTFGEEVLENGIANSIRERFSTNFDSKVNSLLGHIVCVENECGNGSFGQNPKEKWGVFQSEVDDLVSWLYDFIEWMSDEMVGGEEEGGRGGGGEAGRGQEEEDSCRRISKIYILSEMLDAIFGSVYTSKQGLKHVWNKGILDKKQDFFCLSKILDRFPCLATYCDDVAQSRIGPDKNMSWTEVVQDLRNIRLRAVGHLLLRGGRPASRDGGIVAKKERSPIFSLESTSLPLSDMSGSSCNSFPPAVDMEYTPSTTLQFVTGSYDASMEDVTTPAPTTSADRKPDFSIPSLASSTSASSTGATPATHFFQPYPTVCCVEQPRSHAQQQPHQQQYGQQQQSNYHSNHPTAWDSRQSAHRPNFSERSGVENPAVQSGGCAPFQVYQQQRSQYQVTTAAPGQPQPSQSFVQQYYHHPQQQQQHQQPQQLAFRRRDQPVTISQRREEVQWSCSIPQSSPQFLEYLQSRTTAPSGFVLQPIQTIHPAAAPQFQSAIRRPVVSSGGMQAATSNGPAVYVLDQSPNGQEDFEMDTGGDGDECIFDTDVSNRHLLDASQEIQLSRLAANGKLSNGSLIGS